MVKKHKHWVFGKKWNTNLVHPVKTKHRDIQTRVRHDLETKKLQRWAKRKRLHLVDSTFTKYKKEVLKSNK